MVSPPYYPPYNGSVEREHQLLLRHLSNRLGDGMLNARELVLECEVSGHEVNHKRRDSLGGQTACYALESGHHSVRPFGRRQRREVFESIEAMTVDIALALREHKATAYETAFRYAAETWMQQNNMIRVTRNGEVLPPFYQIQTH